MALLGSLTPIPLDVVTDHDTLWLGITVGTDNEMEPRVQLGSVPFAVQALTVPDESVTTNKLADGAVTQAKLGSDISLEPPDGSITTAKIADGAVTSAKLEHAGPHIPITPDENGLVKLAVMRQDDTTDSYKNNQVILTGYGYAAGTGAAYVDETVDMGVTFSDYPIVLVSFAGIQYNDGTSYPDTSTLQVFVTPFDIDHGTFKVRVQQASPGNTIGPTDNVFYTWIAIGTLE